MAARVSARRPALLDALGSTPWHRGGAPLVGSAPDLDAALAFAEAFAPEHLELIGAEAEALAPRVRTAGCVFVGAEGATAFGDYVAGSNHIAADRRGRALRLRALAARTSAGA